MRLHSIRDAVFKAAGIIVTGAFLSSCSGSAVAPVPAPAPPALQRGALTGMKRVGVLTTAQMQSTLGLKLAAELTGAPKCNVAVYDLRYATIGVHGEAADADAGFYVPQSGCKGPFPIVGYAHGTTDVKAITMTHPPQFHGAPGYANPEALYAAAFYAGHGYAVAATDYLGLGFSTYPYHPYIHAESEASAVIDAMRAARQGAARLGVRLSGDVFLSGYSQGGHVTMATQRAIEKMGTAEFRLRGVEPSSGPYQVSNWLRELIGRNVAFSPITSTYTFTGYQKIYGNLYTDPSQMFREPYAGIVERLLPVATPKEQKDLSGTTLPTDIAKFLTPSFMRDFLTNPSNAAFEALLENDLLAGWTAKAPMDVCGGSRDLVVPFNNAKKAYAYFKSRGSKVTITDVDSYIPGNIKGGFYHDAVLVFCEPLGRQNFFDPLRSR